jgi:hypothetical protein
LKRSSLDCGGSSRWSWCRRLCGLQGHSVTHARTHSLQATLLKHAHSNVPRDTQPASSDSTYLVHSHEFTSLPSIPCPPYPFSLRYLPRHRGRSYPIIVYPFTQTQTQPQHPSVNINIISYRHHTHAPPRSLTRSLARSPVHMHMHPYPLSQLRTPLSFFSVI